MPKSRLRLGADTLRSRLGMATRKQQKRGGAWPPPWVLFMIM